MAKYILAKAKHVAVSQHILAILKEEKERQGYHCSYGRIADEFNVERSNIFKFLKGTNRTNLPDLEALCEYLELDFITVYKQAKSRYSQRKKDK